MLDRGPHEPGASSSANGCVRSTMQVRSVDRYSSSGVGRGMGRWRQRTARARVNRDGLFDGAAF